MIICINVADVYDCRVVLESHLGFGVSSGELMDVIQHALSIADGTILWMNMFGSIAWMNLWALKRVQGASIMRDESRLGEKRQRWWKGTCS